MWQYLLLHMALQDGPQQAAGVVGYQQFPFLNQLDANAAVTIIAFCDTAIHFAQTNIEVHKATRIITDCISPAAHLGIDIFCCGRSITTICAYPEGMSFDFDDEQPDRWKTVQDFEIKFLQDLRSAVSVDSYEAVLKAAAAIPLGIVPGQLFTLPQLLSYVTRVAKFFTEVSAATTAKFENKAICAALMRNWPVKMKHLLVDSCPSAGENWESMLERLANKTQQANTAANLIESLTAPPVELLHKHRRTANNSTPTNLNHRPDTESDPNSFPTTSTIPAVKLDSSSFQDIQLICKVCNAKFYFTAGEQAFYTAKGFEDQPKSCKDCRLAAKAEKDAGNVASGSGGGGSSSATKPNASLTWGKSSDRPKKL
jgi:hypothetical protein